LKQLPHSWFNGIDVTLAVNIGRADTEADANRNVAELERTAVPRDVVEPDTNISDVLAASADDSEDGRLLN